MLNIKAHGVPLSKGICILSGILPLNNENMGRNQWEWDNVKGKCFRQAHTAVITCYRGMAVLIRCLRWV